MGSRMRNRRKEPGSICFAACHVIRSRLNRLPMRRRHGVFEAMPVRRTILSPGAMFSTCIRARSVSVSMAFPTINGERMRQSSATEICGFTLIELLVVMAILATLLSIAAPRYFESVDRAKEAVLRTDLRMLREAIDKYQADSGRLPDSLDRLVAARYLRSIPEDPITESATSWIVQSHPDGKTAGVYDVRSGSKGAGRDGSQYSSW